MMLSLCSLFFCGVASIQSLSRSIWWSLMDLWLSSRTNQLWCYYNLFWEIATYGTHQRGLKERNSALARTWNLYRRSFLSKAYGSRERLHLGPITTTKACQISRNIFLEHASVAGQGLHSRLTILTLNSLSSLGELILLTHYMEVIHQGRRPTGKQSTIGQPACLRPAESSASTWEANLPRNDESSSFARSRTPSSSLSAARTAFAFTPSWKQLSVARESTPLHEFSTIPYLANKVEYGARTPCQGEIG